jgi:hypothetical protein
MTPMMSLWLPIVVSTIAVFIASSIVNTVMPWHKQDFPKVPDEEGVRAALRPFAIAPGEYLVPRSCDRKEMASAEYTAKMKEGPVMIMTVLPNAPISLGKSLGQWFVFCAIVSVIAACMAGTVLGVAADPHAIFHYTAFTAFVAYVVASWQSSIWYGRPWSSALKTTVDGTIYALITGGIFMWLWP